MTKKTNSFRDILSPEEARFYDNYRTEDELTPYEAAKFQSIAVKLEKYKKSRKWIDELAWSCVKDVEPLEVGHARNILYSAYVWGQTH